jgi:hypothetical protein
MKTMNRTIGFVSLEDMGRQKLEDFAKLTFQERFDYLKFLQRSFLLKKDNVDVDDVNREFIILPKKKN